MPSGFNSFASLGGYTEREVGYRLLSKKPVDANLGPWEATDGTTTEGVALVNSIIVPSLRYQGLKTIIIANSNPDVAGGETLAYVYWYRGGTGDQHLVEFSSGAGGAAFDPEESYNWTAPQYFSSGLSAAGGVTFTSPVSFSSGFSAGGGVTFTSVARFAAGLSASGITTERIRTTYLRASNPYGSSISTKSLSLASDAEIGEGSVGIVGIYAGTESLSTSIYTSVPHFGDSYRTRTNLAMGSHSLVNLTNVATNINNVSLGASAGFLFWDGTPNTVSYASNSVFLGAGSSPRSNNQTNQIAIGYNALGDGSNTTVIGNSDIISTKVYGLLTTNVGVSAPGATFTNNVYVGGTLEVQGNFYVAGTLTTVNESQLLIQDKYLVLASGAVDGAAGLCAGIYIGSTTSAFASFAYSNDVGNGRWVSNKPMYVNNDLVLTWGNISQIGVTAERLEIKDTTSANIDFSLLMSEPISTNGIGNFVYADVTSPKITYNPSTSTLTVNQVEAIVDGGTW